jgi:hypothetical protein
MKRPLGTMRGLPVLAQDGLAGTLADVHFEEPFWAVRTLVVESKRRHHARRLLIPAASVRRLWLEIPAIAVELTLAEIAVLGSRSDLSLRSARSLSGYRIEARDGAAGRCEDVLVEDDGWSIEAFVAYSPQLFAGSRYLAPAHAVSAIDSVHRTLRLDFTRAQIAAGTSSAYDAAR